MKDTSSNDVAFVASSLRIGIVVSVYHSSVTKSLRDGALAALSSVDIRGDDAVTVIDVPGAFEIPFAARRAAESGSFDAIVCLGCLIRGETPHFEYIASAVAHGVMAASQATGLPITFGVLTTNSPAEAMTRAGQGASNKGWEAAIAAVQLVQIAHKFRRKSEGASG